MRDDAHIGARIATWRRLRGLTQQELAEKANCSKSLIGKIERGERAATSIIISAAGRVLQVDRAALTGQPYPSRSHSEDLVHARVAAVRREIAAYRLPPDHDPGPPILPDLVARTWKISHLRHQADLAGIGAELPGTLELLRHAHHTTTGSDRERVMKLLAEVYYAARQFVHKVGYGDLASLLADRYEWAAAQSGNPHLPMLGDVLRAGELDAAGDAAGARRILDGTINNYELSKPTEQDLTVWGWLHLMAGYMAAHAKDTTATWAHHAEAHTAARRLGTDHDHYRLAFGPTNAAIWGTALGVELMDSGAALTRAEQVTLTDQTPPERAGHHHIDLSRAYLLHGRHGDALQALQAARTVSPQQVRYHPLARDVVFTLAQAERRSSSTLRGMAAWMGIQD